MTQKAILIILPVIFLAVYLYTAIRLYKLMPDITLIKIIVPTIFLLGIISMVIFFTLSEKLSLQLAGQLYSFSTGWLVAFLYLFIGVLLIDFFRLSNHIFHFIDNGTVYRIFTNNTTTSLIVLGVVSLILAYGNLLYHNKKRQHINIESDKISEPVKIVGISDLHIGYTISAKEVDKWVELINSEKPDIVIIAGDIIDNHLRPLINDSTESVLKKITSNMGVYACTGNHDMMFAINEDPDFYDRAGITLLRDRHINLNGITIIGRDDHSNRGRKKLNDIMEQVDRSSFTILLDHQPLKLEEAMENSINFQFSGHTHRGQIFPISLIADKIFEVSHGYLRKSNTHYFVTTGIGIWGGKFRIGTRSEYLVIELHPSS
ncbi:MAG: metallophosphoesterase [Fermentimonas sp.]|uniref:Metallophosphatase domain n=2 Tax=Bacteroidales TaxID=171549 RepID=A0A098BWB0_9BACT|nr:metallophosphoesterase [Fermentimonas sp.]MBP6196621.1 metallophosphoesterase [Fermentimonas sp.]TAH61490.1 MAG: metallophosphoesterase [Fermentimonas caenicola]CEA14949.1 metallophosphatase domain [Fermentimonas caenicola]